MSREYDKRHEPCAFTAGTYQDRLMRIQCMTVTGEQVARMIREFYAAKTPHTLVSRLSHPAGRRRAHARRQG